MARSRDSQKLLKEFNKAVTREWLLTNRRGGFAAGTCANVPTRRYHGLLVAAAQPPLERWMLWSSVCEKITIGDVTVELANFEFPGGFHPFGYVFALSFGMYSEADVPCVRFEYGNDDFRLTKWIAMPAGRDDVILRYHVEGPPNKPLTLSVCPFLAMRDFHGLTRRFDPGFVVDETQGRVAVDVHFEGPRLWLQSSRPDGGEPVLFDYAPDWWYYFRYRLEGERGMDELEDLFMPGWFRAGGHRILDMQLQGSADFGGTTHVVPKPVAFNPPQSAPDEKRTVGQRLIRAADAFIVDRWRTDGRYTKTILAGYPWFGDWGRDAFIALPGLLLEAKRFVEARQVLKTFASAQQDGLIPNRFEDYGDRCIYNSVDASLWYIHAADAYLSAGNDGDAWSEFLHQTCANVIEAFTKGTAFNIRTDEDQLLICGDASLQLTWMDAKHGDTVFTPRHGKPVEVNALWYHALCIMARREQDPKRAGEYEKQAQAVQKAFIEMFWNSKGKYLFDVVRNDYKDDAIRPNQIFAVSLADSPLKATQQKSVVSVVRRELFTPYGLRSLSPNHPHYCGRYVGTSYDRDGAYHQGTVWAWLIGPYVEAYLRVNGFTNKAKACIRKQLKHLVVHLDETGLGSISEIFDGDAPHEPRGCFAQAWSVAELLRAWRLTEPA